MLNDRRAHFHHYGAFRVKGSSLSFTRTFSSDVILCGWLGSKHQLTNLLAPNRNCLQRISPSEEAPETLWQWQSPSKRGGCRYYEPRTENTAEDGNICLWGSTHTSPTHTCTWMSTIPIYINVITPEKHPARHSLSITALNAHTRRLLDDASLKTANSLVQLHNGTVE